ncbi:MAG: dicarboxylate/amino acid:cation symporter [Bacteroidota bacterium]
MKKISPQIQIFLAIFLGLFLAIIGIYLKRQAVISDLFLQGLINYIKPLGTLFLKSLKASAVPLMITSLILGVSGVEDTTKLSRIGGKTFMMYTLTTIFSVTFGLIIGNIVQVSRFFTQETLGRLREMGDNLAVLALTDANKTMVSDNTGWLGKSVDALVPENIFKAISSNESLLQIVVISIVFAIALVHVPARKKKLVIMLCEGVNEIFLSILQMIMTFAPIGVFSLIVSLILELGLGESDASLGASNLKVVDLLGGLAGYTSIVLLSLGFMTFFFYPTLVKIFTKVGFGRFLRAMRPAQLVAFSTSSSSASLPVTIQQVEKQLGVPEAVSSFVLPLGATVNMDGTALYQGIAILFMAETFGIELSLQKQIMVVLYVTSSSIGVAGVPGASIVTTTLLATTLGIPTIGITLIMIPDRILDMCRTVANITGDATVAVLVASSEGWLDNEPDLIEGLEE